VCVSRVDVDRCPTPSSVTSEPRKSRTGCHHSVGALRGVHQAVRPSAEVVGVRCGGDEDFLAAIRTCPAGLFRSETTVGRGRQGLLLEDDEAVRVQSVGALVSRALGAAKLVASDGPMNVPNERRSVESDEKTFMDRHGRSLHLVGADVLHEPVERPFAVRWRGGTPAPALSARAVGDRFSSPRRERYGLL
jgi:hypothetical protein